MTRYVQSIVAVAISLLVPVVASAQTPQDLDIEKAKLDKFMKAGVAGFYLAREADILEVAPLVPQAGVRNAPFSADAVTEFTQTLGDGNRIERVYTASIARDSNGRTRREQEVAMLGPLASLQGQEPKLVIITDPAAAFDYTLDARTKTATRQQNAFQIRGKVIYQAGQQTFEFNSAGGGRGEKTAVLATAGRGLALGPIAAAATRLTTEQLGARQIEGVSADGTRTTMTIPAGALGNVNPIDVVTERWFSKDLQMEVLISRRDPRSGDTVYRLTNIVRAEPPPDLFVVPADYTIRALGGVSGKLIELQKSIEGKKIDREKLAK